MTVARRLFVAYILVCLAGCVSVPKQIAEPHSSDGLFSPETKANLLHEFGVTSEQMRAPDGVAIHWYYVAAAQRGFRYQIDASNESFGFHFNAAADEEGSHGSVKSRGTILFLHGWEMDATSMLLWALVFAEQGYNGVAMDLRNFGSSARAPVGFGRREARDVVALIDELSSRGDLAQPLYLFGVSYGATTALFAEPALRDRVAGIVALEPFDNAEHIVRRLITVFLQDRPGFLGWLQHVLVAWRYDEPEELTHAVNEVDRELGLDLASIDASEVLADSRTCTLLLHGARDKVIPSAVARRLASATSEIEYAELPHENHLSLPLRVGWLVPPIDAWLQKLGGKSGCPAFMVSEDPIAAFGARPALVGRYTGNPQSSAAGATNASQPAPDRVPASGQ